MNLTSLIGLSYNYFSPLDSLPSLSLAGNDKGEGAFAGNDKGEGAFAGNDKGEGAFAGNDRRKMGMTGGSMKYIESKKLRKRK